MNRTDKIEVRMTSEEKTAIKCAAKNMGIDMATFCRMAALEKAKKEGK